MSKPIDQSKKVLIIDDYEFTCNIVTMYFAEFGYDADSVGTAKDGLKLALANKYEVILVDLNLPDGIGLDLVTELRKHKALAKTKIIIFTGNDGETINYYKKHGVDGLLLKPCTFAKVREVINTCLITPRNAAASC
jgi:DNA-binding response OmpR family regulator